MIKTIREEIWPTTTSVTALVHNSDRPRSLILVREKNTKQWGLIAGRLLKGETVEQAMYRRLKQGAGLGQGDVDIIEGPEVLTIQQKDKPLVGLLFTTGVRSSLPRDGYPIEGDETDFIQPFSDQKLSQLLATPEKTYNPEFDIPVIRRWLDRSKEF